MKIGFISLGCSKNLVDTEMMIGFYKKKGHEIVVSPEEADIIVINTCGFITSAKEEAINTILEMADYKNYNCKKLVVTGCLVERYEEELKKELPEVDLFIPIKDYDKVFEKLNYHDRIISTGNTYAYLRIADGCSNYCTYCAIPKIRGPLKSRDFDDILLEAQELEKKGYKELILIAQDTGRYGIDLYGKPRFTELLERLSKFNFKWIRFLYTYPEMINDELLDVVSNNRNICRYFDIPIQHISDSVLKRMNRKGDSKSIDEIISKIKFKMPDAVIRTSLIVGFPGETEEDFEKLCNFVRKVKFNKLGVFIYSQEDGTPAASMNGQISEKVKKERLNMIMNIQKRISKEQNKELISKTYECIVQEKATDLSTEGKENVYIARSYMDAPEIDGITYIYTNKSYKVGDIVYVKIYKASDYDLYAKEI